MESANLNTNFSKLKIIKNLAVISVSFLLIFTAYDGLGMLQTTMNKEEGVGTVSQAVLHSTYGISSLLLSSYIVKKLGTKNTQLLGMALYLPYVAANFYPLWITLVPSGLIIGIGVTLLWGAQCTYFNECSVLYKDLTDASSHASPTPKIKEAKVLSALKFRSKAEGSQSLPGTFRYIKEGTEALSALDYTRKSDTSQIPQGTFENSLENSPPVCLFAERCVGGPVLGILAEANGQFKNTAEYAQGFDNLTFNSPDASLNQLSDEKFTEEPLALELQIGESGTQNLQYDNFSKITPPDCPSPDRCVVGSAIGSLEETNGRLYKKTSKDITAGGFEGVNPKYSGITQVIKKERGEAFELHKMCDAQDKQNQKSKSLSSVNALFFGFHGLAYCSAQVWSNLISFYVLSSGRMVNYNKTSNCSCGAGFCNTDQECVDSKIEEVPEDVRLYYTGVCFACGILAVLLIWLFVDHMEKSKGPVTLSWIHVFATIKFSKNIEQLFIIPMTIITSMIQSSYMADFTKSYIACSWSTSHVGLVSVFYGVTSALSSIISGFLIRLFGRKIVLIFCQIMCIVSLVLLYLWTPDPKQPFMLYLAGGIYGFIVGIFHSQLKALYGVLFQGDEETAFSSCNMYSSIGWALPFVYSEFFCTSVKIYIMLTIACLGLIGYLLAERSFSLRKQETESAK